MPAIQFSEMVEPLLRSATSIERGVSRLQNTAIILSVGVASNRSREVATLRDTARALRSAADGIDAMVRFIETGDRAQIDRAADNRDGQPFFNREAVAKIIAGGPDIPADLTEHFRNSLGHVDASPRCDSCADAGEERCDHITDDAARDHAEKYVRGLRLNTEDGSRYFNRVVEAFLAGYRGEQNPYALARGANYAKPMSRAHYNGRKFRESLRESQAGAR